MANANDLRKGMCIRYNSNPAIVLEVMHRTPGNLRAFVQVIIRYIGTGKSADIRFGSTDKVEQVDVERKKLDFSYKDHGGYQFMDPETYETITFDESFVGDAKDYLSENQRVEVLYVEGKAASIELPSTVFLTVTESAEGVTRRQREQRAEAGGAGDGQDGHRSALHQGRREDQDLDGERRVSRPRIAGRAHSPKAPTHRDRRFSRRHIARRLAAAFRSPRRAGRCDGLRMRLLLSASLAVFAFTSGPCIFAADDFVESPDHRVNASIPHGTVTQMPPWESKIFDGTVRDWWVYVPAQFKPDGSAAVMVFQDGHDYVNVKGNWRVPVVFDNLIAKRRDAADGRDFHQSRPRQDEGRSRRARGKASNRSLEYDIARRSLRAVSPRGDSARGGEEVAADERPGDARDLRRIERRHLLVHGGVGAAGCVSQGALDHRQLHEHPRRRMRIRRSSARRSGNRSASSWRIRAATSTTSSATGRSRTSRWTPR